MRHQPEADHDDLVMFLERIIESVPYISKESDPEVALFNNTVVEDETSYAYDLFVDTDEDDEGAHHIILMTDFSTTSGALESTNYLSYNTIYEFILTEKDDGGVALTTCYNKTQTRHSSGDKQEGCSIEGGVITKERLMALDILLTNGNFDPPAHRLQPIETPMKNNTT